MTTQSATGGRALTNAQKILSALSTHGSLHISQVVERTQIPRPSVYRVVEPLQSMGLVSVQSDGLIGLGTRLLRLGSRAQEAIPEVNAAADSLDVLAQTTGQTSYLCTRRGDQVVCLDWRQGLRVGLPVLRPGMPLPPHAGAATLVILAEELRRPDASLPELLPAVTSRTITDPKILDEILRRVRKEGFSVSDEDVTIGVAAIGVPLIDRTGVLRGALSIAGLRESIVPRTAELVEMLKDHADRVLGRLGDIALA